MTHCFVSYLGTLWIVCKDYQSTNSDFSKFDAEVDRYTARIFLTPYGSVPLRYYGENINDNLHGSRQFIELLQLHLVLLRAFGVHATSEIL